MNVTDSDKYANTGDVYLKLAGIYYRRVVGAGWRVAFPYEVEQITDWAPLRQVQLDAYKSGLQEQGLIS